MDHRHDESLVAERRADADVDIGMQLERVLVIGGIDRRVRAQGPRAGGDEIGGEGQSRPLALELGGIAARCACTRRQIRLEQSRHMRRQREALAPCVRRRAGVRRCAARALKPAEAEGCSQAVPCRRVPFDVAAR